MSLLDDPLAEFKRRTSQSARLSLSSKDLAIWSASRHSSKIWVHVGKMLYVASYKSQDPLSTELTVHDTLLVTGIRASSTHLSIEYGVLPSEPEGSPTSHTLYHLPQSIPTKNPYAGIFGFVPSRGGFEIRNSLLNIPVIFRYSNSPELSRISRTLFITDKIS